MDIKFSYNWNNKLNCQAFTTVRLENAIYTVGVKYNVKLKDKFLGEAEIVHITTFKLDQINNAITHIDTGYNVEDFTKMIKTMYKNKVKDWDRQRIFFIVMKYVNKKEITKPYGKNNN